MPVEEDTAYSWWLDEIGATRSSCLPETPAADDDHRVRFLLHLRTSEDVRRLTRIISSLQRQSNPRWVVTSIWSPGLAIAHALTFLRHVFESRLTYFILFPWRSMADERRKRTADGDLVCWLDPGDRLAPSAVQELLAPGTAADVVFSDGDAIDAEESHCDPALYGGWDLDNFLTQPP